MEVPAIVLIVLAQVLGSRVAGECVARYFDRDSFVCVDSAVQCHRPPVPTVSSLPVAITSSRGGDRWNTTTLPWGGADAGSDAVLISVNRSVTFQRIEGFGGAFTDASAVNINASRDFLPDECIIDSYYGTNGLRYTLGRLPIGGADFSSRGYTYDDMPDGGEDENLENFELQEEDISYKIPTIKLAEKALGKPVKLLASPWSAPAWMKSNKSLFGRGWLLERWYEVYAQYIVRFFEEYKAHGLYIWALTPQNEPIDGFVPHFSFNCMGWTPAEQGKWLAENLGPKMNSSGFQDVKIYAVDDIRLFLPYWIDTIMKNKGASPFVFGVAVHWYADKFRSVSTLDTVHQSHPNLPILYTEACAGSFPLQKSPALGDWGRAENYVDDILDTLNHWNTGWIDWNLALNTNGGPNWKQNFVDSPIIVNSERQEAYKQPLYYTIGHVSRVVDPGSHRIHWNSSSTESLRISAFVRQDQVVVLVVLNKGNKELSLRIQDGDSFSATMAPRSITSFLIPLKTPQE